MPPRRIWLWFAGILLANYLLGRLLLPSPEAPLTVPYTLFGEEVAKGNVQAIHSRGDSINGRFKSPVTYPPPQQESQGGGPDAQRRSGGSDAARRSEPRTARFFTTTLPTFVDPGLETFLIEHGVEISARPLEEEGNPWLTLLLSSLGNPPALPGDSQSLTVPGVCFS
jgi:cell division protease FtsH